MEKFIPYKKLSKKEKKKRNLERRGSWGALSPVTRRGETPKIYRRAKEKAQLRKEDPDAVPFSLPAFVPASCFYAYKSPETRRNSYPIANIPM